MINKVKPAGWTANWIVQPSEFDQLDTNAASALDKRSGQTDTLASNVTVSGSLTLDGYNNLRTGSSLYVNPSCTANIHVGSASTLHVASGGSLTADTGSLVKLMVGASPGSYIDLKSGGLQTIRSGATLTCESGSTVSLSGSTTVWSGGSLNIGTGAQILLQSTGQLVYFSPVSISRLFSSEALEYNGASDTSWSRFTTARIGAKNTTTGPDVGWFRIPVIHGATLNSVDMMYSIASSHFPTNKLSLSIARINVNTNTTTSLHSVAGQQPVAGTDAATYYAAGAIQTFTQACNQNNVIDTVNYMYMVMLQSEDGGTAAAGANILYSFRANYAVTAMPDA
jgi:hypothetical protein